MIKKEYYAYYYMIHTLLNHDITFTSVKSLDEEYEFQMFRYIIINKGHI